MRHLGLSLALLASICLVSTLFAAGPPVSREPELPAVFKKATPEGVADLKAIQDQVNKVLKKAMPATVAIIIPEPKGKGMAAGSGVIVNKDGLVLTAGHISQKPDQKCKLVLADGKRVNGKTLGWNTSRDAGMIQITDDGPFPFAEMGNSRKVEQGDWCLTVGHPGGFKPGRTAVVRLGRVLNSIGPRSPWIQTDTPLVGGDSGGPLFDLHGKVIGIHSWISQEISGNMHVPVNVYRDNWDRLAKGDTWGGRMAAQPDPATPRRLGIAFDADTDDLIITAISPNGPANPAGLEIGDELVRIEDQKLKTRADLLAYLSRGLPDDKVTVEVRREGALKTFTLNLARRGRKN